MSFSEQTANKSSLLGESSLIGWIIRRYRIQILDCLLHRIGESPLRRGCFIPDCLAIFGEQMRNLVVINVQIVITEHSVVESILPIIQSGVVSRYVKIAP